MLGQLFSKTSFDKIVLKTNLIYKYLVALFFKKIILVEI